MKRVKQYLSGITLLVVVLFSVSSCSENTENDRKGHGVDEELTFEPFVTAEGPWTRGYANDFFEIGHSIDVKILTSVPGAVVESYNYVYQSNGIFTGDPGYRFPLNDTYIRTLVATWPEQEIRDGEMITDQREYENYRQADWLIAVATAGGIMPTDAPVPLFFERENTMLEFELVGQNVAGVNIMELLIELEINGDPTACWAYCGEEDGRAYLILPADTRIVTHEGYMVGRAKVDGNPPYTIIMHETDITLKQGTRYLVTLTPIGYDMDMYATIGGWTQGEEGIGIPFAPPVPDVNGEFTILDPQQLITMSYLIRHYNNPASFDWVSRTYNIDPGLVLTEEYANQYIPIPSGSFSGSIKQNGEVITELTYGEGQVLQLYE